jgi:hypothetical protein
MTKVIKESVSRTKIESSDGATAEAVPELSGLGALQVRESCTEVVRAPTDSATDAGLDTRLELLLSLSDLRDGAMPGGTRRMRRVRRGTRPLAGPRQVWHEAETALQEVNASLEHSDALKELAEESEREADTLLHQAKACMQPADGSSQPTVESCRQARILSEAADESLRQARALLEQAGASLQQVDVLKRRYGTAIRRALTACIQAELVECEPLFVSGDVSPAERDEFARLRGRFEELGTEDGTQPD